MFVRAIISEQGQQHCLSNCRYVPHKSHNTAHHGSVLFCARATFAIMHCDEQNLYNLRETRKLWMAPLHLLIWHCFMMLSNTSPSVRRRARGKLRSGGFIFSCSLQHTVRSEFPSWWRYKYENTKWSYLWNDILQTSSQHWINESLVWHLRRK